MKCKEIKQLLSAYADGELSAEIRDNVKNHIDGCDACKELLAEQVKLHEQIGVISTTPALPDMESRIMSAVINNVNKRRTRRWLRPTLIAAPVVLALAILLPIVMPTLALTPEKVLAKAGEAMLNVKSYRFIENSYTLDPTTKEFSVQDYQSEAEFTSNSYHIQWGTGPFTESNYFETIVFGGQQYICGGGASPMLTPEEMQEFTPSASLTQGKLDMLEKIEVLPEETIDGAVCFHYRGTVDIENFIEQQKPAMEKNYKRIFGNYSEEGFRKIYDQWAEEFRTKKITDEFWIGKDDYIIRQWREVILPTITADYSPSDMIRSTSDMRKYYDFNVPIEIKAPLDAQGNLLPGWILIPMQ